MTKKRISPVQTPEAIKVKVSPPAGDLAAPQAISNAIDQVTEYKSKQSSGRPIKPTAANRVPYTTKIKAEYLKELKKRAIDKNISTADLLEKIIGRYLNEGV